MITCEEFDQYARNGAICLRRQFEPAWIESLGLGFERNLKEPGPYATSYTPPGNPGGYLDDLMNWERIAEFRRFVFDSPAARIAGELTASTHCRILLENMLIKEPGTREASPWHQDQPYYCVDGEKLCSIWVPLDPVPKEVCVEFVAGSHRWGKLFTPIKFGDFAEYTYPDGTFESLPDIESNRDHYNILSWDLEPGDCIIFHMRSVHRAPATHALATRRRAFSTRWLGDDAVYVRRPGAMFPEFDPPYPVEGEPMDHPAFPIIWRR